MVLLVQKLAFSLKHLSKLENHHHHSSEPLSVSLQTFRSDVSNYLTKLSTNSDPGSEFLSLKWIQQCLEALPIVNKAFAKLVADTNYPMNKWEVSSIEEYLNYSLSLLEFLNSISSAVSRLSQARFSLSHALSLIGNFPEKLKPLKEIKYKDFHKDLKVNGIEERKGKFSSEKDMIFHQAMLILMNIGLWVYGVVVSGLCSDVEPYMEMRKSARGFVFPPVMVFDLSVWENMMENGGIVKELKEVNDAVANGENAKELQMIKLEVIEKVVVGIKEETNLIFFEVLAGRNELLDILRRQKM